MPELRNVRPDDAIRAFQRAGGSSLRQRGSHYNIKMPNGYVITIPTNKSPVKVGVLVDAIKKAGLTREQFIELLR